MVSNRCKMAVREELKKLGLHFIVVDLGEVEIMENISAELRAQLKTDLLHLGFELMDDKKAILIEKIKNVIGKNLPSNKISSLLTVDSMLGQNSFEQAKIFHESTNVDGIVLTKMDGTGKGGIVFSITQELNIPVAYISFGETVDQIALFDPENYVKELF